MARSQPATALSRNAQIVANIERQNGRPALSRYSTDQQETKDANDVMLRELSDRHLYLDGPSDDWNEG